MTPKEKAGELLFKFNINNRLSEAKNCAFKCVDEVFDAMSNPIEFKYKFTKQQMKDWEFHRNNLTEFWEQVKNEINIHEQ